MKTSRVGTLREGKLGAGMLSTGARQAMLPADAPTGAAFGKHAAAAKPRRVFPLQCSFPARRGAEPEPPVGTGQGERLGTARSRVRLPAPAGQGGSRALDREKKEERKKNRRAIFVPWSVFVLKHSWSLSCRRSATRLAPGPAGKAKSPAGGERRLRPWGRGRKEGMGGRGKGRKGRGRRG